MKRFFCGNLKKVWWRLVPGTVLSMSKVWWREESEGWREEWKKLEVEAVIKNKSKEWVENIMKTAYRFDVDPGKTKTPSSPTINQVKT